LELADFWNSNIEPWTSVSGTPLAKRLGARGYYVLVLPVQILERPEISHQVIPIHNRAAGAGVPGDELVSTEFLQLVRFGLRSADDPLILDSVRVADALLKTATPCGPV
jgi:glucoamylase